MAVAMAMTDLLRAGSCSGSRQLLPLTVAITRPGGDKGERVIATVRGRRAPICVGGDALVARMACCAACRE